MASRSLPSELVALVHHVELNRAGWWNRSLQQILLAVLMLSDAAMSLEALCEYVDTEIGLQLSTEDIVSELQRLESTGRAVRLASGAWKVSENEAASLRKNLAEATARYARLRERFLGLAAQHCGELDAEGLWTEFLRRFFAPLCKSVGARLYEVLSGPEPHASHGPLLRDFSKAFPEASRSGLRVLILDFMSSSNPDYRAFALAQLNAQLIAEASHLSSDTVEKLATAAPPPRLMLFVDTNVLFSILGLHDNPANETASALVSVLKGIGSRVPTTLYVLPATLEEAKHALGTRLDACKSLRLTPNLAKAALETASDGITRRFIADNLEAGRPISAESYFGPYLENLITIVRSAGLEVHNASATLHRTNQGLVDDVLAWKEREERLKPAQRRHYEAIEHDCLLWRTVSEMRPTHIDTPLAAAQWVVTVDFRFLAFDRHKTIHSGEVGSCIHPATLSHMLQFWVPRDDRVESALVDTLRLPLMFPSFDVDSERVTLRILAALGRYESVNDLSVTAVRGILVNDALRARMARSIAIDEEVRLIESAVITENAKLSEAVERAQSERAQAEASRRDAEHRAHEASQQVAAALAQLEAVRVTGSTLERERTLALAGKATTESALEQASKERDLARTENEAAQRAVVRSARSAARLLLVVVLAFLALTQLVLWERGLQWRLIVSPFVCALLMETVYWFARPPKEALELSEWKAFTWLRGLAWAWIFAMIVWCAESMLSARR